MARRSLRPHLNQIRSWVRQGRTDAWIAHQLEVSVGDIRSFKRDHDLAPAEADRLRRERLYRQAAQRSSKRRIHRTHKAGSMRFVVLVLVLLATAALVTAAMFRALYIVMG